MAHPNTLPLQGAMRPMQPGMPGMGMPGQMGMGMAGQMPGNSMMGGMGMSGQMGMGGMAQPSMGMSMPGMMTGPGQHPAIPGVQPSVQAPQPAQAPAPAPAPASIEWAIPQQKRVGYMAQFQANDKARTGFL